MQIIRMSRAVMIGAVIAGMALGAALGHNNLALGQASLSGIVQALKAPFMLLAARSPGERGEGALLLTKRGPHERVLSTVRDREPVADAPFAADAPPFAGVPEGQAMAPQNITPNGIAEPFSQNGPFNAFPGLFPFGPFGFASLPIGPVTPVTPVGNPPGDEVADTPALLENNPPEFVPTNPSTDSPPGTDAPPSSEQPPPTVIAEPASWGMMLLGLLAIVMLVRRPPKRSGLSGFR